MSAQGVGLRLSFVVTFALPSAAPRRGSSRQALDALAARVSRER